MSTEMMADLLSQVGCFSPSCRLAWWPIVSTHSTLSSPTGTRHMGLHLSIFLPEASYGIIAPICTFLGSVTH